MLGLRYYCRGQGTREIGKLLDEVGEKCGLTYEIVDLSDNGAYDGTREKLAFKTDFEPYARNLYKRTGQPIRQLRSPRFGQYFLSIPGTLAITRDDVVQWYVAGKEEIIGFLQEVTRQGYGCLEARCK